jgi:hypothetical protein
MTWKNKIQVNDGTEPPRVVQSILPRETRAIPVKTDTQNLSLTTDAFEVNEKVALWIYAENNLRGMSEGQYDSIYLSVNPPKQAGLLLSKIRLMLSVGGKLTIENPGMESLAKSIFGNAQMINGKVVCIK